MRMKTGVSLFASLFALSLAAATAGAAYAGEAEPEVKSAANAEAKPELKPELKPAEAGKGGKVKVKGRIKAFDLKERTVAVDVDGVETVFVIGNDKALEKLDTKLFVGDEVKIKFVDKDGRKTILEKDDMRGTKPGC